MTNQPLSAVTNDAYKEKMAKFDPSFIVPGEKKLEQWLLRVTRIIDKIYKIYLPKLLKMFLLRLISGLVKPSMDI